ncbi:hypothetical protein AAEX37_01022 [Oligella sp. MSHR50489EDL]
MIIYIIACYIVFILLTLIGSFSKKFNANVFQRISLGFLSIWAYWRIHIVLEVGVGWPHEPFLVTWLLIYSISTVFQVFLVTR